MEDQNLRARVDILERQLKSLIKHFDLVIERGLNQVGPDECVGHWIFRPICKECGR